MNKPVLNIGIKYVANNPNNVIITDSTDYTALGLDSTKVKINTKIYLPTGTLYVPAYYNTPAVTNDFSPAVPFNYRTKLGSAAIPDFLLDSHGCFINGLYKVDIKWYYVDTAETFDYSFSETMNFKKPEIVIDQKADCFCAKFRSTDKSDYTGTTEISYEHIINYPAETNEADIETTLKDYLDERLANGTYVSEVTTERLITISPVFSIQATLYGKESIIVDCDTICELKCGINNLNAAYEAQCGKDSKTAKELKLKLDDVLRYYSIIYINNACGVKVDVSLYIQKIKAILGDCDCGCKDCNDDIWVTGVCGSSGGSSYDPTPIYDYIDAINIALTNLISSFQGDLDALTVLVNGLINQSWFTGLTIPACLGFVGGDTEIQKRNKLLAKICTINAAVFAPPVAKNDVSTTLINTAVSILATANDFFTSNPTITVTTAPSNGTAVVQPDGKTIIYTPGTGYTGVDTVGYTLTDANGQTSTAVWTITVNAVPAVSCSTVEASYSASFYPMGTFLQIAIQNLSSIGTNVLTAKNYIIEIRDVSNAILLSYSVTGSLTVDPTIFTTPVPFAANWNNVRIQQTITTQSATGAACGTVVYETPTPFLLTDVSLSWFYGTTISPCLGILDSDTEIEKKNKLMSTICKPIYVENGLTGNGLTGTPIKQGGTFTEDTTINANDKNYSLNNYKKLSYLHGGATTNGVGVLTENVVKLNNFNESNGYVAFVEDTESTLNDYTLTNGKGIISKINSHTVKLESNVTTAQLGNGSLLGNSFDNFTVDSVAGDYSISQDQTSGRRNVVNRRIATQLSPLGLVNKATIGPFANLELITNATNVFCNTWQHFVQLYIRNAKGSGSIFATLTDMPLTYGIYQEGVADKNIFFGEVQNASGSVQFTSDIRVKENIQPFTKSLTELEKIETKTFEYKYNKGKKITGIIAQELEEVIPEAVEQGKFTRPDNNETFDDFRMVDQSVIFYTMLNSIKELSAKNKDLEARIIALENK